MSRAATLRPVLGELGRTLRSSRRALGRLALWSVPEAVPALLSGYAVARALDDGFAAGRVWTGLAWLGVLGVAILVGAAGTRQAYRCLGPIVEPFRDELVERVVGGVLRDGVRSSALPPDTGSVARLTHQVEVVRDTFAGLVMTVRQFLVVTTASLIGLLSLTPVIGLVVLPAVLAGVGMFVLALPAMVAQQRRYVLAEEGLSAVASTSVAGLRDVAACGAEEQVRVRLGEQVHEQAAAERALARMAATRSLCLAVAGWVPVLVVLLLTPWLAGRGVQAGAVIGGLTYIVQGLQPALRTLVDGLGSGGLRFAVTLARILQAATPAEATEPAGRSPLAASAPPDGGGLALHRVTFSYGRHAEPVVRDLDLTIGPGEHLAIVGPSGIGKSTIAGLLAGTLHPQRGALLVDGRPAGPVGPAALAGRRVLIPQQAYVFSGSLADNLRYLRPDASRALLDEAVSALGMESFVDELGGYQAQVAPARLSAGQRQLVALARAYLAPAPLALLDEATCHLDPVAEARVERAFADRPGALVVIAHRITSAMRARRVLVMDGSRIAVGSHDSLLEDSGLYRDLVGHWADVPEPAGISG